MKTDVVVAMPAYNENASIADFITEIDEALRSIGVMADFVVVDDHSTVPLAATISVRLAPDTARRVLVLRNDRNRGHGPTVLRGYRAAIATGRPVVVHVDGDGQFTGADIARVVAALGESDAALGRRTDRREAWYRAALSRACRALLASDDDVNTPLRAYQAAVIAELLAFTPDGSLVPHLHISRAEARLGLTREQVPVRSLSRRGPQQDGVTWGRSRRHLPPWRLVRFALSAALELARAPAVPTVVLSTDGEVGTGALARAQPAVARAGTGT